MILRVALLLAIVPCVLSAEVLTVTRVIRADTILEPADLTIIAKSFPGVIEAGEDIVGLETKNMLYPGRPIRRQDVGPIALVKRNQMVKLIFRQGGLTIATDARALQRGAEGDQVRVMNMSSRTTVSGTVARDGSIVVSGFGQ
jgi:flagella basal body P-ring formation protein FlgA